MKRQSLLRSILNVCAKYCSMILQIMFPSRSAEVEHDKPTVPDKRELGPQTCHANSPQICLKGHRPTHFVEINAKPGPISSSLCAKERSDRTGAGKAGALNYANLLGEHSGGPDRYEVGWSPVSNWRELLAFEMVTSAGPTEAYTCY